MAKINKDEVVGLCSEINGYKIGFMDALALWDSEPDLQAFKELFEKWWIDYEFDQRINALLGQCPYTNFEERIDYELKEEYGTSSRKEVAKIMIDDFETSSEDEAKSYFFRKSFPYKRDQTIPINFLKSDYTNKDGVLLWKKF